MRKLQLQPLCSQLLIFWKPAGHISYMLWYHIRRTINAAEPNAKLLLLLLHSETGADEKQTNRNIFLISCCHQQEFIRPSSWIMWKLDFFIIKCAMQRRAHPETLVLALVSKCCDCTIINRRWLDDIDFLAVHSSRSCFRECCYWFITPRGINDRLPATVPSIHLNASYLFQPDPRGSCPSFQHWALLLGHWSIHRLNHQRGLVLVQLT